MRLILGLILLLCCTLIGYCMAGKFIDRKTFYNDFLSFVKKLKQEVSFGQATIIEIVKDTNIGDFCLLIENYFNSNNKSIPYPYLNNDDKKVYLDFVEKIGKSDGKTQLDYLNDIEQNVSNEYTKASENEKIYKKLYIKMGFLVGLILLILVL